MKRLKMGLLACLVVACMGLILAGCQQEEYTPEAKDQAVSATALGKAGTLRVGVNADSVPLAGMREDNTLDGIDVYLAYALADELGLKAEIVDVQDDFAKALSDGTVDVVLGVDAASDDDFWRSTPYIQKGYALFGMSSETAIPALDSNPKIAAQGSKMGSWLVVNLYGDDSLVSADSLAQAFEMLNKGTDSARYVAADALKGLYTVQKHGYSNKIVALLEEPSGYCVGVSASNTELQNAINAAVTKIANGGMMDVFEKKFLPDAVDLSGYTVVKSPTAEAAKADSAASSSASSSEDEQPADEAQPAEGDDSQGDQPAEGEAPQEEQPAEGEPVA